MANVQYTKSPISTQQIDDWVIDVADNAIQAVEMEIEPQHAKRILECEDRIRLFAAEAGFKAYCEAVAAMCDRQADVARASFMAGVAFMRRLMVSDPVQNDV